MKTLKELKNEAQKILDIPDVIGEYSNVSFYCRSGGSPKNKAGVPEVHRSDDFAYNTTANGAAYRGEVVVLCKDTSTFDAEGNKIYITPDGVVFVFQYYSGSAASFDGGCLREPRGR
jgi:hypothetical protein